MKNRLAFSADGKAVQIIFASGSESFYFESKEEALFALQQCFKRNKIDIYEMDVMYKEIILAKNLPDRDPDTFIIPFAIFDIIKSMKIKIIDLSQVEEEEKEEGRIKNPTVAICDCKDPVKHGYVYDENGEKMSPPFQSKIQGLSHVQYLLKQERITEVESATLNTLIHLLPICEDISMN